MANESIKLDKAFMRQAAGYYSDASSYIDQALVQMSNYNSYLYSSGFTKRVTKFNYRYESIYQNVSGCSTNAMILSNNCTSIIDQVELFEQQQSYNSAAVQASNAGITAAEIQNQTNTQVGSTNEKNSVWENIWGWMCDVAFPAIKEFIEGLVATFVDLVASLLQGLVKLVEGIVDAAILLVGSVVGVLVAGIGSIWGGKEFWDSYWNGLMGVIAYDWTSALFNIIPGLNAVREQSWLSDSARSFVVSVGEWVGIAVVGVFTGGVGAALVAGVSGLGDGAELAYQNGGSYWSGVGIGLLNGTLDAMTGYCVGNVAGSTLGNFRVIGRLQGTFASSKFGTFIGAKIVNPISTALSKFTIFGKHIFNPYNPLSGVGQTALVPYTGPRNAIVPYVPPKPLMTRLLNGLVFGGSTAFKFGVVAGIDKLQDNMYESWLTDDGKGTIGNPTIPNNQNNINNNTTQNCSTCGLPKSQCTCSMQEEKCSDCGLLKSQCKCGEINDRICPKCLKLIDECICDKEQKCPNCGLPKSQCRCGEINDRICPKCLKPIDECICGNPPSEQTPPSQNVDKCPRCGYPVNQCICTNDPVTGPEPSEPTNPGETCPICGLPKSQCTCSNQEEKCPNCGLPKSQCTCGMQEEEEKCPTCGLPLSQCPGHEDTPSEDDPSDGGVTEDPEGEHRIPNITFENVGPDSIEIKPTNPVQNTTPNVSIPNTGGNTGGSGVTVPDQGGTNQGTDTIPEFSEPVVEEPVYEFESMTPTVENPDLLNYPTENPVGMSSAGGIENVITSLGGAMENVSVTPLSDLSQPTQTISTPETTLDTSTMGMGGIAFGAAATSLYGASKRTEKSKDKEEFKRKTEEDKEKFEQI